MAEDDMTYRGDLVLSLAEDGRLTLGVAEADELIAGIEHTLSLLRMREWGLQVWRQSSWRGRAEPESSVERFVFDAAFSEQIAPGRLEAALRELPKYLEAFQIARERALAAQ
ncbi:hypothetical protein V1227_06525 [Lentzea sp. DG1S-22]|uniref:hypothetical protein n=1 Tax=Lentzea sp. DG1S-22 TaxID=3108822 RepID=UPI002E797958|nr:hypothetical protein [Lentzea sp. DG1S-22]WVH82408.1 hypothetical protein V1227_06525 [Lentzea sp. DG1S-22]